MSAFWLGATVSLAVYFALQVVLSLALFGREMTIDRVTVVTHFVFMTVAFLLANLLHLGLI